MDKVLERYTNTVNAALGILENDVRIIVIEELKKEFIDLTPSRCEAVARKIVRRLVGK